MSLLSGSHVCGLSGSGTQSCFVCQWVSVWSEVLALVLVSGALARESSTVDVFGQEPTARRLRVFDFMNCVVKYSETRFIREYQVRTSIIVLGPIIVSRTVSTSILSLSIHNSTLIVTLSVTGSPVFPRDELCHTFDTSED